MATGYEIPRWIQPADPAAHYQAGFALGTHLGAQQAAQAFQQQQLARELQKDEFERQSQMALMQLKVDEAARQHRANAAYQAMIARGIDPMEALKSVGPEMGIDPSRVMAMQEQRADRAAQQAALNDYRYSQLQERDLNRAERARESDARLKEARLARQSREQQADQRIQQTAQRMKQSLTGQIARDKTLNELTAALNEAQKSLMELGNEKPGWFSRTKSEIAADKKLDQETISSLQEKIKARRAELTGQFGQAAQAAGVDLEEEGDTTTTGSFGDNNMPDQPAPTVSTNTVAAPTAPGVRRLRFKNGEFIPVE